jgi:hypothetical protein
MEFILPRYQTVSQRIQNKKRLIADLVDGFFYAKDMSPEESTLTLNIYPVTCITNHNCPLINTNNVFIKRTTVTNAVLKILIAFNFVLFCIISTSTRVKLIVFES